MREPNHKYIATLVVRAQLDDSDAFAELYGLTYHLVYHYALRYLRDDYLAQDAVQEIYILALKNLCKLNNPTLFVAWIKQISFRVCFDIASKSSKSYGSITDPDLLKLIKDDNMSHDPSYRIEKDDEYNRLREAILQLPANEKQAIILRYYNNLKIDEIASLMSISKSTTKRYLASAHQTLAQIMK